MVKVPRLCAELITDNKMVNNNTKNTTNNDNDDDDDDDLGDFFVHHFNHL